MAEFQLEIGPETDCQTCGAAIPLSSDACPGCSTDAPHRVTFEEFFIELEQGRMLGARQGGLVIGRSGPDDDIPMYRHFGKGIFEVVGLMQGGEFIVSKLATEKHREWLEENKPGKGRASCRSRAKAFAGHVGDQYEPFCESGAGFGSATSSWSTGSRLPNGWMNSNGVMRQRTVTTLPGNSFDEVSKQRLHVAAGKR